MIALIDDYNITVLPESEEAGQLAKKYILAGIFPKRSETDALHVSTATVAKIDIIVSLNFRHIVKLKTVLQTEAINTQEGYKQIFIHSPAEVIEHEKDT